MVIPTFMGALLTSSCLNPDDRRSDLVKTVAGYFCSSCYQRVFKFQVCLSAGLPVAELFMTGCMRHQQNVRKGSQ